MIIEFRVQNFRSFRSEQVFSMVASNYDKSLPENIINPELPGLPDLRLVKAVALYGPNAGGKTNLLLALKFLQWLAVESATGQKPDENLPVEPFLLDRESGLKPTILSLTFVVEEVRFELSVAVTRERVVQERLVAYPSGRAQLWYDRVWNTETTSYEWLPMQSADFDRDEGIVEKTRSNSLFLSTAALWNNERLTPIYQWFAKHLCFRVLESNLVSHHDTATLMKQSKGVSKSMPEFLKTADLGIAGVSVTQQPPDPIMGRLLEAALGEVQRQGKANVGISDFVDALSLQVAFEHKGYQGELFAMKWANESAGTQHFFNLLGPLIRASVQKHVLCLDEFGGNLHPTLAMEIIRLLLGLSRGQGKTKPQLLFTTHNPLLLDMTLLRRDQVWFADKDNEGASFLYPLTDYKPRADESLVRGYLSGRYGAVPFIPRGLVGGDVSDDLASISAEVANAR